MWHKREMVVHESDPYNAEPPRNRLLAPLTDADSFYVRNHGPVPELSPDTWSVAVTGLVSEPVTLSLGQLQARFAQHTVLATMQCAGNRRSGFLPVRDIPGEDPWGPGATSTARWTGVRLGDVLRAAGVHDAARHVEFAAPEVSQLADPPQPYGGSVPLGKALADEVLLAWGMNGAPLPPVHGGPVRVVVPGYVGARSVKWVRRITVRADPSENYFQATAYRVLAPEEDPDAAGPGDGISLGPVALNCDILSPEPDERVGTGPVLVRGYAHAGDDRRVARVDVSGDGGRTWCRADLDAAPSPWAWQHWRATVELAGPGPHTLLARAWDSTGACQPESAAALWNPKGYVNNSWARVPVNPAAAAD
ncbi:sulfite oxidase [Kocuria tytonis]|uniref:Sulfite oxidase n=1 Tax=Kocuria tytonis TaxID=2054280 RepID=A0A495A987_9MICC|nr:sulfite oxidase [Kocuria tytonis]RKQ36606.1 sulfite oxidase [Kocuria tytonis]